MSPESRTSPGCALFRRSAARSITVRSVCKTFVWMGCDLCVIIPGGGNQGRQGLTAKQQRVLDIIRDSIRRKGQPPTVREIGASIGVASSCTVQRHLDALEKKGCIRRDRYKYRSIELADQPIPPFIRAVNVPILGQIAAGVPMLAQENIEDTFPLPMDMVSDADNVFMLRVKGDSMIDAGI